MPSTLTYAPAELMRLPSPTLPKQNGITYYTCNTTHVYFIFCFTFCYSGSSYTDNLQPFDRSIASSMSIQKTDPTQENKVYMHSQTSYIASWQPDQDVKHFFFMFQLHFPHLSRLIGIFLVFSDHAGVEKITHNINKRHFF